MPLLDLGLTLGIGIIIGGFFGRRFPKREIKENKNEDSTFNDSEFSFLDGLDFKKFGNCPFDVISVAKNVANGKILIHNLDGCVLHVQNSVFSLSIAENGKGFGPDCKYDSRYTVDNVSNYISLDDEIKSVLISAKNHYMKKRINSAIGVEKTEDEKLIEEELTSGVNKALKKLESK